MTQAEPGCAGTPMRPDRAAWMRVLALADPARLDAAFTALGELPPRQWLRVPQTGMAMVRARSGGTGEQFNLGEMTVTRCAITLAQQTVGVAYVQGRLKKHAEQAAVLDALLQLPDWHARIQENVIAPLARQHDDEASRKAAVAAQTRVEFFTLMRGED